MKNEFIEGVWYKGTIIEVIERLKPFPYLDLIIKSPQLTAPKVKASLPLKYEEGCILWNISQELNKDIPSLKGTELMYKFYRNEEGYKMVNSYDIKNLENYEEDKFLFDNINELNLINGKCYVGNEFIEKLMLKYCKEIGLEPKRKKNKIQIKNEGAYIEIFRTGVNNPINIIDFESFYQSIALTHRLHPKRDIRMFYFRIMEKLFLRKRMLAETNRNPEELIKIKAVLESMVGCLNNQDFLFRDNMLHRRILKEGRNLIQKIIRFIEAESKIYETNGKRLKIIRVHTDGIILAIKKEFLMNELLPKLNKYLKEISRGKIYYNLKYKGTFMKGIFRDVNNYVLFNRDEPVIIKGKFFKEFDDLLYKFLYAHHSNNYEDYKKEKEKILKNKPSKKELDVLDYLEKHRYSFLKSKKWTPFVSKDWSQSPQN